MKKFGLPHYSVNTINLGLFITDCVFYHKGLGPETDLSISYNSLANTSGLFGRKWIFSYESIAVRDGNRLKVISPSGKVTTFQLLPTGKGSALWQAPQGCFDSLVEQENYWHYFNQDNRLSYCYQKNAGKVESQLIAITDQNGNTARIEYQSDGKIHKLFDAVGREIVFAYHDGGWCRSFSLEDGRSATFEYDSVGHLIKTTDFAGIRTLYEYDREGYLLRMCVGRKKRTTNFYYLNRSNFRTVESIVDAMGNKTTYELTSLNPRTVRITHPEGNTTSYQSQNGLTEKVTDSLGFYTSTQYENGQPVRFRDKRGFETAYAYDARGNQVEICYPGNRRYRYEYDLEDRLVKRTDPLSHSQQFEYDENGNLIKMISPSGKEVVYRYNEKGQITEVQGEGDVKFYFEHDSFGNIVRTSNTDGLNIITTYDALGYRLMSSTDENGNTHRFDYDANNRLTFVTNPDGSHSKNIYDCCSGLQAVDELGNKITYERDLLNNITSLIDEKGAETKLFYNGNAWLSKIVDPMDRVISLVKNANGLTTSSENPSGGKVFFDYDEQGNLLTYQDQQGKQILFEYNSNNEVIKNTDYMGESMHYKRDDLGRIVEVINARGNRVAVQYDAENRVIEKRYDQEVVAVRRIDDVKNTIKIEERHGTVNIQFDETFLPVEIAYPNRSRASFAYDNIANLEKITYGDQLSINYVYDARDRLTSIKWQDHFINLSYDKANNLLKETRSNDTHTDYEVNTSQRIMALNHIKGDEVFAGIKLDRDVLDRVTNAEIIGPVAPPETLPGFQRSIEMDYDAKTLLVDGQRYAFDLDGNLITGKDWAAVYDHENMPVEITFNGWHKQYTYDSNGFRVSEKCGDSQVDFQYDLSGKLLFESNADGAILKSYIYGGDRLFAVVDSQGDALFYHYDDMGNTMALTDAAGNLFEAYDYEPYGQIRGTLGKMDHNRFTFGGSYGVMDEGQGLYAYKRRFYHSGLGMFIQKDPIGLAGGGNDYAFAAGNPKLYVDPQGTSAILAGLFAAGSAIYGGYRTIRHWQEVKEEHRISQQVSRFAQHLKNHPTYWQRRLGENRYWDLMYNPKILRDAFRTEAILVTGARDVAITAADAVVDTALPPKPGLIKTFGSWLNQLIGRDNGGNTCDPPSNRKR